MKKLLLSLAFLLSISCGTEPLFTKLTTSNVKIIFKGTYASNNPRLWWDGSPPAPAGLADDSISNTTPDELPDHMLFDIGEVRMNSHRFATNRFYIDADMNDDVSAFNGTGISVATDDLYSNHNYNVVKVFIRKFIINKARSYNHDWEFVSMTEEKFSNREIAGYDVVHNLQYIQAEYDEDDFNNNVYPFEIPIEIPFRYEKDSKLIIEIRINLKNNLKYYEYADSDNTYYYGFYAPADYLHDVTAGNDYIGGNLLGAVKFYVSGKTVDIRGTAPVNRYVVAIEESDDISNYIGTTKIPPHATWCSDGTYLLTNVPVEKSYKIYYSSNTPDVTGGLVESFIGETQIEIDAVQIGNTIELNL